MSAETIAKFQTIAQGSRAGPRREGRRGISGEAAEGNA
jgi:hypothetical protein